MIARTSMKLLVRVVGACILAHEAITSPVVRAKCAALFAAERPAASVAASPAASVVSPLTECASCKEDRIKKNLPVLERIRLPPALTDAGSFRRPKLGTYVCTHCDGETLVTSALRNYQERQGK